VDRQWGGPETNRELQIQGLAAARNLPTNSVYTSRQLKDCAAEAAWAQTATLEPGVLYLISPDAVRTWPGLAALAQSPACRSLPWVLTCSLGWGTTPAGAAGQQTWFVDRKPLA
jgi:hypothetical protein